MHMHPDTAGAGGGGYDRGYGGGGGGGGPWGQSIWGVAAVAEDTIDMGVVVVVAEDMGEVSPPETMCHKS